MTAGGAARLIAIAGAGIAGLSAAIALKLEGFEVALFERETSLEPIGAGIQLGPNATRIMERWTLDLLGASCEPEGIEIRNALSGALLNTIPLHRVARARYGAPYVTLLRADLQRALLGRVQELGVKINYGAAVANIETESDAVTVEAGGTRTRAAALIGADGLNSSVRNLVGYHPCRYSAHATAWRGLAPPAAVSAPMRNVIAIWMAGGAHLVHYPVSGGARINAILIVDDVDRRDAGAAGQDPVAYFHDRLQNWAELPRSIVEAASPWSAWRMHGLEKWPGGQGRIQVIGDAWHAMRPYLASGGVMAIEDGAALARSLAATPGTSAEGLKRFREERGPRVWRVVKASAQVGRVYHLPRPFSLVRDAVIKAAPRSTLLARNDWLYGPLGGPRPG